MIINPFTSKKILFIITKPILGGAQKWTLDQIKLLHTECSVSLVCSEEGWLTDQAKPYVEEIVIIKQLSSPINIFGLIQFVRYLQKKHFHLIVASSANAGVFSRLGSFLTNIPNIYVSHGWSAIYRGGIYSQKIYILIERLLASITTCILTVSLSDKEQAINIIKISPSKLTIIENGIFSLPSVVKDLSQPLKLVMVARFDYPKRQDLLIQALKDFPYIHLTLVGEGPNYSEMKQKYESSSIHFLGSKEDVFSILMQANVFTLISDHEGLPVSILEALSAGLPLMLSNIPAHQIFISGNGILVENTVESIREGLLKLQYQNLNSLSENSNKLFKNRFDLNKNRYKYHHLYLNSMQ